MAEVEKRISPLRRQLRRLWSKKHLLGRFEKNERRREVCLRVVFGSRRCVWLRSGSLAANEVKS